MIQFELPKQQSSIIKVIGVGGGGSNAVNYMYDLGIEGVDFVICNTDAQALAQSMIPNRIQLGPHLTQGLGAGANPEIGRQATEESLDEIRRILEVNTKMVFITAGMGGGTGTGGAPIVAQVCREMGILTVGIVTTPFGYEGKKRFQQAEEGIRKLRPHVDTLLVISNDKLRHQFGELKWSAALAKADNVLATATKCITDVINSTGQINLDFSDVCTVMRNGGVAILGSAVASGEHRAHRAVEMALNSPLLNDNDIRGAQWILLNILSAEGEHEITVDETEVIQNYVLSQTGEDVNVLLGLGYDNDLGDNIGITLIATGFASKDGVTVSAMPAKKAEEDKIVVTLGVSGQDENLYGAPANVQPVPASEPQDMMPRLVEEGAEEAITFNHEQETGQHVEQERYVVEFDVQGHIPPTIVSSLASLTPESNGESTANNNHQEPADPSVKSGGFLAKPSNIYAEQPAPARPAQPEVPHPADTISDQEEASGSEMKLVYKDVPDSADRPGTQWIQATNGPVEDPAMQDEIEEQRRKAAERLYKLRNLSYNNSAADLSNEFDSVPAYIRRNMELMGNSLASVEKFYSNYTVKADEENNVHISTINTFLDGKKPD